MKDSAHMHDIKANDFPKVLDSGLSDIVIAYNVNKGWFCFAQYGRDGYWHEKNDTFGDVTHWYDGFPIPNGMEIDYSYFGGEI